VIALDDPFMRIIELSRRILSTDFGVALAITLAWKIVLLCAGYGIDQYFGGASTFLDHTLRWDAGWYLAIIHGHYVDISASAAFYPLFPLLVYLVHFASLGLFDYPLSGQIINTIAIWFTLVAALKLGRTLIAEKGRFWIIALLLSAPAAFFMHVFYGEAIFIALSYWAYYFALTRRWVGVGILLGLLTATKLPSILIIALCGLEFMRAYAWDFKKIFNKNALYFLIAPAGFLLFSLYLFIVIHDALGMFHAYKATTDWVYHVFNPNIIETIGRSVYQIPRALLGLRPIDGSFLVNIVLPIGSLTLLGLSSLYLALKHRAQLLPLAITGFLSIIMFTLNSNVVSVHRYILPCLGVYVALILFFSTPKRRIFLYGICALGFFMQMLLLCLFIQGKFAG